MQKDSLLLIIIDFCARNKWHVAFYQVYPQHLDTYRALKMHAFKMGEEALLNPQSFTLRGAALANVRTSSRRAEREGARIEWYEGVPPPEVMRQLEHISTTWLEHKGGKSAKETSFSVGRFDELTDIAERADTIAELSTPSIVPQESSLRFLTAVAVTKDDKACAF